MAHAAPLTIDQDNKVPDSRIPDAASARDLWTIAWEADLVSSRNRTAVQKQIDGVPPFNGAELKRLGLGGSSNLNFGEAQADMDRASAAFNDLLLSQERMAFIKLKQNYGTPSTRTDIEDKIAIAYHKVVTDWEDSYYEQMMLAWWFNKDGVGIYIFPDDRDPRWRAENLDGFKIPRNTKASESKVGHAFARHYFQLEELYKYIKDAATARKLGWNVKVAREAIKNAYNQSQNEKFDWAMIETRFKNNDISSTAKAIEIRAQDIFVREFSGKLSHHNFLEQGGSEYMFTKIGRFSKATEAFIISTYGIGSNGCYHGIRGLGFRIFPFVEHSNRIRNKILDGTAVSQTIMFEADDASAAQRAGIAYIGPYSILPAGLKPVPIVMPNPSTTALPVIADLERTRLGNTGGFMTAGGGTVERKEMEIQQEMANQAVLPSSSINLFMIGRGKMMTEQFRRLSLKDWAKGEPGYEMAKAFQDKLKEDGVPLEALDHVESIIPARAMGAGSPAARQLAFQNLGKLFPSFDEIGQNNYMRDMVGSEVGFDQVDRYVPKLPNTERPVIDQSIAELENGNLKQGIQCSVLENQDQAIHLKEHVKALVLAARALQQGGDVMEAIKFFAVGIPHAQQHYAILAKDPSRDPLVKSMKPVLSGLNTMATQLIQAVQKNQQKGGSGAPSAPAAPGGPSGASPAQLTPEQQAKIAVSQAQIQVAVAQAQTTMKIRQAESMQRMQLRDAKEAQNIRYRQQREEIAEETAQ